MCPTFPSMLPLPLLTLRLSTSTILDTVLLDIRDMTPLFTIETVGNKTVLHRAAAASNGQTNISHAAAIHWPVYHQQKKDSLVFIDGVTMPSSAFLKKSLLGGGSRKFHIPGQSNPLKWKHVGAHWECTLCSHACTAHRAVATFEPAHTTSAARLAIYTQGVRRHDDLKHHEHYDDIDMDMLLYLVLTSLLLTTPPMAWQDLQTASYQSPISEKPRKSLLTAPIITTSSPSKSPRIDLLSDDLCPSSIRSSPNSASSCYSSLPPSPLTPCMDLSPIHHDTFAPSSPTSVFRRNSNRMPSPLITCSSPVSTSSPTSYSSSSPTTVTPGTPTIPAGPTAITPYHLPPSTLHPHHHHHTQPQRSHTTSNALHLETSHIVPYTTQMYNLQFAGDEEYQPRRPSRDELPPAYSEIEWTVRVKQPRQNTGQLRLHAAPVA